MTTKGDLKKLIKLQSNVPLPSIPRAPREPKYPFSDMGVYPDEENNTFFIPGAKSNTVHSAITRFTKSDEGQGKKFSIRATKEVVEGEEDKGEQEGIRVWRTQ